MSKTASLDGDLDAEIFTKQPEGFVDDPSLVCELWTKASIPWIIHRSIKDIFFENSASDIQGKEFMDIKNLLVDGMSQLIWDRKGT